jgi:hypothetical protein
LLAGTVKPLRSAGLSSTMDGAGHTALFIGRLGTIEQNDEAIDLLSSPTRLPSLSSDIVRPIQALIPYESVRHTWFCCTPSGTPVGHTPRKYGMTPARQPQYRRGWRGRRRYHPQSRSAVHRILFDLGDLNGCPLPQGLFDLLAQSPDQIEPAVAVSKTEM